MTNADAKRNLKRVLEIEQELKEVKELANAGEIKNMIFYLLICCVVFIVFSIIDGG